MRSLLNSEDMIFSSMAFGIIVKGAPRLPDLVLLIAIFYVFVKQPTVGKIFSRCNIDLETCDDILSTSLLCLLEAIPAINRLSGFVVDCNNRQVLISFELRH